MKIVSNPRDLGYNVYCDTDSEYRAMSELANRDVEPKQAMKLFLNSMYGKAVTDMNKDYIIIHVGSAVAILFKLHICAVQKHSDGTADIYLDGGQICHTADKYEDIIKQLV